MYLNLKSICMLHVEYHWADPCEPLSWRRIYWECQLCSTVGCHGHCSDADAHCACLNLDHFLLSQINAKGVACPYVRNVFLTNVILTRCIKLLRI